MKKDLINGGDLFIARVRVVLDNDPITGDRRTAHYNNLGYRLFLKKNEKIYIDVLTGKPFPVLTESLGVHDFFILDPKPFWVYAHSLRMKERPEDVKEIAQFVAEHFNKNMHNEKKWSEAKDKLHKIHHKNDNDYTL